MHQPVKSKLALILQMPFSQPEASLTLHLQAFPQGFLNRPDSISFSCPLSRKVKTSFPARHVCKPQAVCLSSIPAAFSSFHNCKLPHHTTDGIATPDISPASQATYKPCTIPQAYGIVSPLPAGLIKPIHNSWLEAIPQEGHTTGKRPPREVFLTWFCRSPPSLIASPIGKNASKEACSPHPPHAAPHQTPPSLVVSTGLTPPPPNFTLT